MIDTCDLVSDKIRDISSMLLTVHTDNGIRFLHDILDFIEGKAKALVTNLDVPFSGAEFLEAWGRLLSTKEWSKKTVSQLQWNLDRLKAYPEEFATILVNEAFNGGRNGTYLGVVFESTPSKYERWLAQKNAMVVGGGAPIGQHTMFQQPAAKPSKVQSALGEAQRAISMIDNLFPEGGTTDEQ